MSNRRTLRRLARTGDPTLVTEAGHRARALPAAAPPAPPPDDVILSVSYYDCDGNRIPVTSFTYSHGAVPARAAAEATDIVTYSGYGDALSESAPTAADRYRCTGRELDSVTGLQYNRIRWFDPSPGRWVSAEPLGFDASDANVYPYVNADPAPTDEPNP